MISDILKGSYSFLNRLLYYCIFVFALFGRAHLWLVAGALAGAMTYAGTAAVHAALLVWRGPNPFIEYDGWPLLAILSSACLITVPLLNWSQTLRNLGEKFADPTKEKDKHVQRDYGPRAIVIYWGILVTVGFICIWQQLIWFPNNTGAIIYMDQVICRSGTNASSLLAPDGKNYLYRTIDDDFIRNNGCNNPCNQVNVPSIFRKQEDLTLLSRSQNELDIGDPDTKSFKNAQQKNKWFDRILTLYIIALPIILIQGFVTVSFGRRCPHEIRDFIYIKLYRDKSPRHSQEFSVRRRSIRWILQDWSARLLAFTSYIGAVAVILICPPFFIAQIIIFEQVAWAQYPDAEPLFNIGQWQPWGIAVQAIIAALIAKYHQHTIERLTSSWKHRHGNDSGPEDGQRKDHGDRSSVYDPEEGLTKPKTSASSSPRSSTPSSTPQPLPPCKDLPPAKPPRTFGALWHNVIMPLYKMSSRPLNQSGTGLGGEIKNFWAWCRDPCSTSKYVSRHPLRDRDRGFGHHNDEGEVVRTEERKEESNDKGEGKVEEKVEQNGGAEMKAEEGKEIAVESKEGDGNLSRF